MGADTGGTSLTGTDSGNSSAPAAWAATTSLLMLICELWPLRSTVTVTYTNPQGVGFYQTGAGTDFFNGGAGPTSPYTSSLVDNRPFYRLLRKLRLLIEQADGRRLDIKGLN